MPPYPKKGDDWKPTGVIPTGIFPSSFYPSGVFPTGGFPTATGIAHPTGPRGTGHHKSVHPTYKPILPRQTNLDPFDGYPMPTGSFSASPHDNPDHDTVSDTFKSHPTGGPSFGKHDPDAPAPYPTDSKETAEKSDDCSTEKHAHKTGHKTGYKTGHKTGTHPRPTGVKHTGVYRS